MLDVKNVTINIPESLLRRVLVMFERFLEIAEHHFPTPGVRKDESREQVPDDNYFVRSDEELYDLELAEVNRKWRLGDDRDDPQADYDELVELRKGGHL